MAKPVKRSMAQLSDECARTRAERDRVHGRSKPSKTALLTAQIAETRAERDLLAELVAQGQPSFSVKAQIAAMDRELDAATEVLAAGGDGDKERHCGVLGRHTLRELGV